ncbi:hypothetical protein KEM54_003567 [Ascosphaera aggregata]|nr:hypothetical protein KEM54_003567 [Ascosphaera aggregata]
MGASIGRSYEEKTASELEAQARSYAKTDSTRNSSDVARLKIADRPSAFWTGASSATMYAVAGLCRAFLYGVSKLELHGQEEFFELLDSRVDRDKRKRGLITVSNHISVYAGPKLGVDLVEMDDPIMWGTLPLLSPTFAAFNRRWSFGSHDICFVNRLHSPTAGLFQPTMTQAIRLISKGPFPADPHLASDSLQRWSRENICVDPFSEVDTAYTTTGNDSLLAPSAYACNSYSWIHIFPEGKIHQTTEKTMRYFKWGIARLILEANECPDVVPIWIEGTDDVMNEARTFPRFLPRLFKRISITFGAKVDPDKSFGDLRERWQMLVEKSERNRRKIGKNPSPLGVLDDEELMTGKEAKELRIECTKRIRDMVLEVRRSRGHPEEDPKEALAETWAERPTT